jgi:hypothetical protein
MSVSSEVQRTLVKSPPELWAELSDPATLGRHLGELGEIRIVGTEPERTVDWEAAAADGAEVSGRVEIEPSGWGTRVTLSASRSVTELQAREPEPEPEPEPEAIEVVPEVEPAPEASPEPPIESAAEPAPVVEADPESEALMEETKPRRGFFARIFRRRRREPTATEAHGEPEPDVDPNQALESEPTVEPEPEPPVAIAPEQPEPEEAASEEPPSETSPKVNISAELAELEEQTAAVLTGVLDRLGAAHHRPFSRA